MSEVIGHKANSSTQKRSASHASRLLYAKNLGTRLRRRLITGRTARRRGRQISNLKPTRVLRTLQHLRAPNRLYTDNQSRIPVVHVCPRNTSVLQLASETFRAARPATNLGTYRNASLSISNKSATEDLDIPRSPIARGWPTSAEQVPCYKELKPSSAYKKQKPANTLIATAGSKLFSTTDPATGYDAL